MKNKKLLFNSLLTLSAIALLALTTAGTFNFKAKGFQPVNPDQQVQQNEATAENGLKTRTVGFNWMSAGPDNFAGRTRSLIVDRNNPNTIYAGSVSGGLWVSTTGGIIWNPIPNTEHIMNVSTMMQDATGKIYVGTGEAFETYRFNAFPGFMGNGIFVSHDGQSFDQLASTVPAANDSTSAWAYINRLAIQPVNGHLYAATHKGLNYSADGGQTWEIATDINGNPLNQNVKSVKTGPDGVTAAAMNNLLYISTNGDHTQFVNVVTGEEGKLPATGVERYEMAVAPSNANVIYAVAVKTAPLGSLHNVYVSDNKGDTWRIIGPGGSTSFQLFGTDNVGLYANDVIVHPTNDGVVYLSGKNLWTGTRPNDLGNYSWENKTGIGGAAWFINSNHHTCVFHPTNPNTVYIGTDRGVYRSVNNLASFQNMNRHLDTEKVYSVAFNSGRRILAGTQSNGTLFISETGNTDRQAARIDNIQIANAGHVAMSAINQKALFWSSAIREGTGSQAAVPLFRSDDLGATISLHSFSPTTTANNFRTFLPAQAYWESVNFTQTKDSVMFYADKGYSAGQEVIVRSKNSRYPFKYTLPTSLADGDSILVKDPIASKFFYHVRKAATNEIYMTTEALNFTKPSAWFRILLPRGNVRTMNMSHDGNYLWAGTENGLVYRLGNMHNAYNAATSTILVGSPPSANPNYVIDTLTITIPQAANRMVNGIAIDPRNPNHVVVVLGNYGRDHYVFRSTNATSANPTFTSIQGNLPKMPVYSVLIEMNDPNTIILGTEKGVWVTTSPTSGTWAQDSGPIGDAVVTQIKQQLQNFGQIEVQIDTNFVDVFPGIDNFGKIYASTFGRGVYKSTRYLGIGDAPQSFVSNKLNLTIYPNPAKESVFVSYEATRASEAHLQVIDLSGRIVVSAQHKIVAGSNILQTDISSLKKGIYIIQLKDGSLMLTNKLIVR